MKKIKISIICALIGTVAFAQDITKDELYLKYENEIKRISTSEDYLIYKELSKEYSEKTKNNKLFIDSPEFITDRFEEHLEETNFKTVEEAKNLFDKMNALQIQHFKDLEESSVLLNKLQKKYNAKLIFETYDKRNSPFSF